MPLSSPSISAIALRLICALLCLGMLVPASAQQFPFRLQYLTTDDGLTQNTVDDMLRDSEGFMWFATWNGLCRYDGYEFKSFRSQSEAENGLPDNQIHAIAEDASRRIWIGTAKGISVYSLEKQRFLPLATTESPILTANVTAIYPSPDGRVWLGTKNDGLFAARMEDHEGSTSKLRIEHHVPATTGNIISLTGLSGGNLVFGTSSGLFEMDPRTNRVNRLPSPIGALAATALYEDAGDLWVGTNSGLYRYTWIGGKSTRFDHDPIDPASLLHNTVTALCRDSEGNLIVGTLGGINFFEPLTGTFSALTQGGTGNHQLNNRFVNSLLTDTLGNVWIGTEKGGVNKYNLHQHRFEALTHRAGGAGTLSHATVNSVLEENNILWIGTAGGGLNRLNRKSGDVLKYQHDPARPESLRSDFITTILRGREADLWLGTWGEGVNLFNTRTETFTQYLGEDAGSSNAPTRFVSSIYLDPRDFLLVGSEEGLATIDPGSGEVRAFRGDHPLASIREVGCILLDSKNYYWIGTRNALFRFPADALNVRGTSISSSQIERYTRESGIGLPGDYILSLREDHRGRIWLGTYGRGIAFTEAVGRREPRFKGYDERDGLGNNVVYTIEIDDRGWLWLGTDHGLSSFDPQKAVFTNYNRADGLLSNQFYWSASHRGGSGYLYFGSVEGLNYFRPSTITKYPDPSPAVFTSLEILNDRVGVGEELHGTVPLRSAINRAEEVSLSYRDNVFSIAFSSLDFFLPDQTRFAYRMAGVDKDWVTVSSDRRFASYTNLRGGDYTFEVKASNGHGSWQEIPTRLRVVILPPFYHTAWFRILIICLFAAGVFGYMRWRFNFLRTQTKKLEVQVRSRTAEIERQKEHLHATNLTLAHRQKEIAQQKDQLEIKNREISQQRDRLIDLNKKVREVNQVRVRFFTNISHEFRTPLTLILDPLEHLLERFQQNAEVHHSLKIVNRNAQRLLHLINQLMSFRRIEEGQQTVRVAQGDAATFIKEVFLSFQELAEHQQIDYRFALTNPRQETWFDAEKLEHILYNLLSNALKFTPAGGKVSLELKFLDKATTPADHPIMEVVVRDTGAGIPPEEQELIFDHFYQAPGEVQHGVKGSGIGLALVRELVKLMHGEIALESNPGEGSTFTVRLPYLSESYLPGEIASSSDSEGTSPPFSRARPVTEEVHPFVPALPASTAGPTAPLVLIVEDNYDLRFLLTQRLGKKYRILSAEDGLEGLELAETHSPDLVISDIMMPRMDGIELCRRLKTEISTSHIPVILLTAKAMVDNWVEGLETGADDYVAKPFNLKILLARIDNLIRTRRRLRKLFGKHATPMPETATNNPIDQQFLKAVYQVLEDNFADPDFSQDDIAATLCISRSLLYKKIKSLTDRSVTDFVNFFKLEKARALLAPGGVTISEVAYQTGFSDPKYFSRIFKKFFGYPPSEYAARQRKAPLVDPGPIDSRLN